MPGRERQQEGEGRQRRERRTWSELVRLIYDGLTPGHLRLTDEDGGEVPDAQPDPQVERARPYEFTPEFMCRELNRVRERERQRLEMYERGMQQMQQMLQTQTQTATQQWFGGTSASYQQYCDAFSRVAGTGNAMWQNITASSSGDERIFEYRGVTGDSYSCVPNANDAQLDYVENVKLEPKRRNLPK